jgi:NitT/TauT family transport system substrate-binding protein
MNPTLARLRSSGRGALVAAVVLLAAGSAHSALAQSAPAMIRVATTPSESGSEVYYAADMGFFKKEGLDVEITTLQNGGLIGAGVSAGQFDIAQSAVPSIAGGYQNGLHFMIVAPAAVWKTGNPAWSALLVPKTSSIKSAKDLEGKTVGVNAVRNILQIAAAAWIDKNGGDSSTVHFLELPWAEMSVALATHRVDAAAASSPDLDVALADNRILSTYFDALGSAVLISAWYCSSDYAAAHPDIVRRFQTAIVEAGAWANKNPAQSAQIIEKYTKIRIGPNASRLIYPDKVTPAMVQPVLDASAKYKALKSTFPAAEIIAP